MSTRLPQQGRKEKKKFSIKSRLPEVFCNNLLEPCNNWQVAAAVKKGTLSVKAVFNYCGLVRADRLTEVGNPGSGEGRAITRV